MAGSLRPLTQKQKLAFIRFTGTLVNDDGRITDHMGYPMIDDCPAKEQHHRISFDEEDDHTLTCWLAKAAVEGISLRGPRFFKDLELIVRRFCSLAGTDPNVFRLHVTHGSHGKGTGDRPARITR